MAKVVAPKKEALAIAETELEATMGELRRKQATLKAVEDELAELQRQFEAANRKKADLEQQVQCRSYGVHCRTGSVVFSCCTARC